MGVISFRYEFQFHEAVADYLRLALRTWWTSIDHSFAGQKRGAQRKRMGVRPGLPDIWILFEGELYLIELKMPSGRESSVQL